MSSKINHYKKIIRAEKTSKNIDDTKVVIVGICVFLFLIGVQYLMKPDLNLLNTPFSEVSQKDK